MKNIESQKTFPFYESSLCRKEKGNLGSDCHHGYCALPVHKSEADSVSRWLETIVCSKGFLLEIVLTCFFCSHLCERVLANLSISRPLSSCVSLTLRRLAIFIKPCNNIIFAFQVFIIWYETCRRKYRWGSDIEFYEIWKKNHIGAISFFRFFCGIFSGIFCDLQKISLIFTLIFAIRKIYRKYLRLS